MSIALADDPSAPRAGSNTGDTLQEVVVSGYHFLDADTSGITNLPLPVEQVPQSVSLLNNDFVKAADLRTISDIAQYTVGGFWSNYVPSYGSELLLRGLPAGFAVDGLPVGTSGDPIAEPDAAILERYEVVKGPASVVYGAESPGGIVNLVSKSARADTPDYVSVLGGSWDRWRVEGQAATALNDSGSVRIIGVAAYEQGGSFIDFVNPKKAVAYAGLDFTPSQALTGYFRVSYQRLQEPAYNGIPVFADGSLPAVGRSFFVGGGNLTSIGQATRVNAGLTWQPADAWSFDLKSVYEYRTHGGENAYYASLLPPEGSFPISAEKFNHWDTQDFTIAASALRKLDDLGLAGSSVSASVRYQHYEYSIYETFLDGTANIFSGDAVLSNYFNTGLTAVPITGLPNPAGFYQEDEQMDYVTGSTQAVLKILNPLTLVGGVAYSYPWIDDQQYEGAWRHLNPGGQVDYRAALIFEPVTGLNLYGSYSESYQPNLRIDVNYNVLPPISGTQYEAGAKYRLPGANLLLTAGVFQLKESNVPTYAATVNNESLYLAEGVRHRGVELEATGQLAERWQFKGGIALLDPKVTQNPTSPANIGETRPWLAKTTGNLYTSYEFLNGISVGGGVRYVGAVKTHDDSSPATLPLPAYTLFDATLGYDIAHWHLQLNAKNIFDRYYYTNGWGTLAAGLLPGEPRSFSISARRDF